MRCWIGLACEAVRRMLLTGLLCCRPSITKWTRKTNQTSLMLVKTAWNITGSRLFCGRNTLVQSIIVCGKSACVHRVSSYVLENNASQVFFMYDRYQISMYRTYMHACYIRVQDSIHFWQTHNLTYSLLQKGTIHTSLHSINSHTPPRRLLIIKT